MKLSILVPVYNEEKTLQEILEKVIKLKINGVEKEIIVINDASTDATSSIAKKSKELRLLFIKIIRVKELL